MLDLGDLVGMNYFDTAAMFQENWLNMQKFDAYYPNVLPSCEMPARSIHEMNPQQSLSVSNNSTSDEAEEQQQCNNIIDERRQRRMISNRESARRSRMRKQKQLDVLWSHMTRLKTENHVLLDKFNHVFESHYNVAKENAKLKDEVSQLRKMVNELQFSCPDTFLSDFEEIIRN